MSPISNIFLILFSKTSIPCSSTIDVSTYDGNSERSMLVSKSVLFKMMIRFLSAVNCNNSRSSAVNASLLFKTSKTNSASLINFLDFSTPIASTISFVSRIPAVSIKFKVNPPILIYPSTVSRVVPAMLVTGSRSAQRVSNQCG